MAIDPDHPDPKYLGLEIGHVVDRDDPKGLGRVRVRIPGLVEPASAWAWPLGTLGGGSEARGAIFVPEKGAEVGVMFKRGDPDKPYYWAGHWGKPGGESEVPEREAADGHPDVRAIETKHYSIRIDDRDGSRELVIRDKGTGDRIEHDGVNKGWTISGSAAVVIESTGLVQIEGLALTLNGRTVKPGSDPI